MTQGIQRDSALASFLTLHLRFYNHYYILVLLLLLLNIPWLCILLSNDDSECVCVAEHYGLLVFFCASCDPIKAI